MECYTQLVPPTAVNACVSLPFTSATANNLILARSSLLQVYSLKAVLNEIDLPAQGGSAARRDRVHTSKLVLVAQYELPGAVLFLRRVRIKSKSEGNLLLVALKEAKLSLIEWDPERNAISTISIHYYEKDDLVHAPWDGGLTSRQPVLSVDPGSRCAAFKFGNRQVALLPFRQNANYELDDVEGAVDGQKNMLSRVTTNDVSDSTAKLPPTPIAKSSVLSLLSLDPALVHPIDIAFMYGYRDPTLAVLSSTIAPSHNLLSDRRDVVAYTVYTLDIDQRASTTLLSVTGLPFDIRTVVPLPNPIGGVILVGANELIHVDQAGKANGLAVNDAAKQCTSFPLVQQGGLDLRLEDCVLEPTGSASGDVLLILRTGQVYILSFRIDGRTVSALDLQPSKTDNDRPILAGSPSCAANVGRGRFFIGSRSADSVIVGWNSNVNKLQRKQSHISSGSQNVNDQDDYLMDAGEEQDEDDDDDDDDDLYATSRPTNAEQATSSSTVATSGQDYTFRVHDVLLNLAPLGTPFLAESDNGDESRKSLFASSGGFVESSLVRITPFVSPINTQVSQLAGLDGAWPITVSSESAPSSGPGHNVLITSKLHPDSGGESHAYRIGKKNSLAEIEDSEFDSSAGASIDIFTYQDGGRIIQILEREVRIFDGDFGLDQICPLFEEEALDRMPNVLSASFAEPYVLLLRDDARITILKPDESGDLEEMELSDKLTGTRWMSGCLYDDPKDGFQLEPEENEEEETSSVLAFLLTEDGGLQVYQLPNTKSPVYVAPGLSFVPPYLSSEFNLRRPAQEREEIVEILVAELGDAVAKSPYLLLRSNINDLILYQPFQHKALGTGSTLRFMKVPHTWLPKATSEDEEEEEGMGQNRQRMQPLRVISDLNGFSSVVMPGASSCLVLKAAASHPQVFDMTTENLRYVTGFSSSTTASGLLYVDEAGTLAFAQLPKDTDYSTGWCVQKPFTLQHRIDAFAQHRASKHFVLGASTVIEFKLPHDDLHPEWDLENTSFFPQLEQGSLQLVNSDTWALEDSWNFEAGEVVMTVKAHSLEVSETSHQRRDKIVVGTAKTMGEDVPVQGHTYVFDVVPVVPDPEEPEKSRAVALKLVSTEEFRGGVTAICPVGTEGLMMVAQGQKCMVRGLTESDDFLPTAAIDVQCFVSAVRELPGSGLMLIADAVKGLWFAGYNESPYNIRLFGRSKSDVQVRSADFLPDQDRLYIVLADAESMLHVLQFDPHNPQSLAGQRLLPLSTFHTGVDIGNAMLLPRQPATYEALATLTPGVMDVDGITAGYAMHQILVTGNDGSVGLVTPLNSAAYSTLTALQTYLSNTLQHPLGLNPRAWRNAEADRSIGGCLTIDGNVLKQWMDLGSWKRIEGLRRTGLDQDWELRMVLEGVGVRGLGYL